jgi:ABC-type transport system involved in multi-copper enzyme maturation permease subunit
MEDEIPSVDDLFPDDDLQPSEPISEELLPIAEQSPQTIVEDDDIESLMALEQASAQPEILPTDAEFMGEKGGVVTGRGRMEAAFGTGDGDETATAQVAQVASDVQTGTIFHQVYRPWRGKLNSRWVRNWAILRYHIYGLFSKGHKPWPVMTKLVLFGVLVASIGDLLMLTVGAATGIEAIERLAGISRGNLYGHVLSFWFRNACTYPIVTALIIGGMISEDRRNGTSALYFSRPINRRDYAAMKFLSVAIILSVVVLFTLSAYYLGAILVGGEGWSYVMDTGLLFLGAFAAGTLLVFTYTSIGLALSSVSSGKFFPAVAFIGLILGTKMVAFLIWALFDSSAIYLISPYDNLAHVGQWMLGLNHTYEHPASWSLVMLITMNAVSLYILSARVSSLEVTRE